MLHFKQYVIKTVQKSFMVNMVKSAIFRKKDLQIFMPSLPTTVFYDILYVHAKTYFPDCILGTNNRPFKLTMPKYTYVHVYGNSWPIS